MLVEKARRPPLPKIGQAKTNAATKSIVDTEFLMLLDMLVCLDDKRGSHIRNHWLSGSSTVFSKPVATHYFLTISGLCVFGSALPTMEASEDQQSHAKT